jgi:hypothetical protein
MRALAGYHNINMAHKPPRLDTLGDDTKIRMEQFMTALYPTNFVEFSPGGRLRPFIRIVMAYSNCYGNLLEELQSEACESHC